MQNVCCCHRLLARPILSRSYLFSSLFSPCPSFSYFPFFIAPNLKMARYEMLPVRIPRLQRDLSSAETEALLCSCWRVALAASAQAGNSRSFLHSSLSKHHLDVAGIFFVCFPQGCRWSKTAVSAMVCRETSFYMNECKETGLCISVYWARKPLPKRCSWPWVLPAQSSLKTTGNKC